MSKHDVQCIQLTDSNCYHGYFLGEAKVARGEKGLNIQGRKVGGYRQCYIRDYKRRPNGIISKFLPLQHGCCLA